MKQGRLLVSFWHIVGKHEIARTLIQPSCGARLEHDPLCPLALSEGKVLWLKGVERGSMVELQGERGDSSPKRVQHGTTERTRRCRRLTCRWRSPSAHRHWH
jgi:hypothetical protein